MGLVLVVGQLDDVDVTPMDSYGVGGIGPDAQGVTFARPAVWRWGFAIDRAFRAEVRRRRCRGRKRLSAQSVMTGSSVAAGSTFDGTAGMGVAMN